MIVGLTRGTTRAHFARAALEAMAFGKPVLCANVASLPEVAGDAALYFAPGKPQLEEICLDEALRAKLGLAGRERAQRFRWEPAAQATLNELRAAVDQRNRSSS